MKIFSILDQEVKVGALIEEHTLSSGVTIPAVSVGQRGRNRRLVFIPVEGGTPGTWIHDVELRPTRNGGLKFVLSKSDDSQQAVVVAKAGIGYRGSNRFMGDKVDAFPESIKILAEGKIAQGGAGYMGAGYQRILVVPKDTVFSVRQSGRLYGAPARMYYVFNGTTLLCATAEERRATDLF